MVFPVDAFAAGFDVFAASTAVTAELGSTAVPAMSVFTVVIFAVDTNTVENSKVDGVEAASATAVGTAAAFASLKAFAVVDGFAMTAFDTVGSTAMGTATFDTAAFGTTALGTTEVGTPATVVIVATMSGIAETICNDGR